MSTMKLTLSKKIMSICLAIFILLSFFGINIANAAEISVTIDKVTITKSIANSTPATIKQNIAYQGDFKAMKAGPERDEAVQYFYDTYQKYILLVKNAKTQAEVDASKKEIADAVANVKAVHGKEYKYIISSPGIFTPGIKSDSWECERNMNAVNEERQQLNSNLANVKPKEGQKDPGMSASAGSDTKAQTTIIDMGTGIVNGAINPDEAKKISEQGYSSKTEETGLFGINCSEFSIMNTMTKLYTPVNITSSEVIMGIVYVFQIVALSVAVLLIAVYGVYYATGSEQVDPFRFLIRAFIVMLIVYYLPYFAQDILGINNALVYYIGQEGLSMSAEGVAAAGGLALASSINVILANLVLLMTGFWTGVGLLMLLLLIFFLGVMVKAIVTLLFWWYARFLMLIFLIALGPLFVVTAILPKTSKYASIWLQSFIGEVATQSFMVIAIYFANKLFQNIGTLAAETGIGIIGTVMLLYAVILLLEKIPDVSRSIFGGALMGIVGWNDAKAVGKQVGDSVYNAGRAAVGAMANHKLQKPQAELDKLEALKASGKGGDDIDDRISQQRLKRDDAMNRLGQRYDAVNSLSKLGENALGGKLGFSDKEVKDTMKKATASMDEEKKIARAKDEYNNNMSKASVDAIKKGLEKEKQDAEEEKLRKESEADENFAAVYNAFKDSNNPKDKERINEARDRSNKMKQKAQETYDKKLENINKQLGDEGALMEKSAAIQRDAEGKLVNSLNKAIGDKYDNPIQARMAVDAKAQEIMNSFGQTKNQVGEGNLAMTNGGDGVQVANSERMYDMQRFTNPTQTRDNQMKAFEKMGADMNKVGALRDTLNGRAERYADRKVEAVESVADMFRATGMSNDKALETAANFVGLSEQKANGQLEGMASVGLGQMRASLSSENLEKADSLMAKVQSASGALNAAKVEFASGSGLAPNMVDKATSMIQTDAGISKALTSDSMRSVVQNAVTADGFNPSTVAKGMSQVMSVAGVSGEVAQGITTGVMHNLDTMASELRTIQSASDSPGQIRVEDYQSAMSNVYQQTMGVSKDTATNWAKGDVGAAREKAFNSELKVAQTMHQAYGIDFDKDKAMAAFSSGDAIANYPTNSPIVATNDSIAVEKTKLVAGYQNIPDTARQVVIDAVQSGKITYDSLTDSYSGDIRSLSKVVEEGLDDAGHYYQSRDVSENYVNDAVKGNYQIDTSYDLPKEMKKLLTTTYVESNGKADMDNELDKLFGENKEDTARKMAESYISKLKTTKLDTE